MWSVKWQLPFLPVLFLAVPSDAQWEWKHNDTDDTVDPVQVYDLYPEGNDNFVALVNLMYNESFLPLPFTICFWLYPFYFNATEIPLTLIDQYNFLQLRLLEGRVEVSINQSCPFLVDTKQLEAHHWHQLCTVVDMNTISLYMNGHMQEKELRDEKLCPRRHYEVDSVSVLLGLNSTGFQFTGQIADLRLYPRRVTDADLTEISICQLGPQDYLKGSISIPVGGIITKRNRKNLCEEPPSEFLALFDQSANHLDAMKFCSRLSGRLMDKSDYSSVARQMVVNKDVTDNALLVWTKDMLDEDHGVALNVDREGGCQPMRYSCLALLNVVACMIPFHSPTYWKRQLTELMYAVPYKGRLLYQSHSGLVVSKDTCRCENWEEPCLTFKVRGERKLYSILGKDQMPLGRRVWNKADGINKFNVTLSRCGDDEFTCNDGECISLDDKCNGQPQCTDKSDEGELCSTLQDQVPSYWKTSCPSSEPSVDIDVNLMEIRSVSVETNSLGVCLTITLTWSDPRLIFSNLHNHDISLSHEEAESIWFPKLFFPNAQYEDNIRIQSNSDVLVSSSVKAINSGQHVIKDSHEVREHNGSSVRISKRIKYLFTLNCAYNYSLYPFDVQECNILIQLQSEASCNPVFGNISVESESTTVAMYVATKLHYCTDGSSTLYLHLLLSRDFRSYLLTIFIPCIILCLLSHLTITHFNLRNFSDRINVTLSVLLVLASLFSQVSVSLPQSPEAKLVDIFFFYCIVRVSLVFVLHSIVGHLLSDQEKDEESPVVTKNLRTDLKLAWFWEGKEPQDYLDVPKRDIPKIINRLGNAFLICADVIATCTMCSLVILDYKDKHDRFNSFFSGDNNI